MQTATALSATFGPRDANWPLNFFKYRFLMRKAQRHRPIKSCRCVVILLPVASTENLALVVERIDSLVGMAKSSIAMQAGG